MVATVIFKKLFTSLIFFFCFFIHNSFALEIIRDEDYVVAASSHKGLKSGNIDFLTFGRNEPALHHYHNTYREALGLQKLPIIES